MSASEVYAATDRSDVVAATAPDPLGDDPRVARKGGRGVKAGSKPSSSEGGEAGAAAPATVPDRAEQRVSHRPVLPEVAKPIPIRTPARVMRAWIAPWEDARGRAHAGGNVFIEIETRRWLFGESETTVQPVRFFSIQTPDSKEPVGKDPRAQARGASERSTRPNSSTLPTQGAPNDPAQHKADTARR